MSVRRHTTPFRSLLPAHGRVMLFDYEPLLPYCFFTYFNRRQTSGSCPEFYEGEPVTIPGGTYSSTVSQDDADAQALAAANAALVCTAVWDGYPHHQTAADVPWSTTDWEGYQQYETALSDPWDTGGWEGSP